LDLETLYINYPGGFEKEVDKVLVLEKERRKLVILKQDEEIRRQKNRLNWLALGNKNIIFSIFI